MLKPILDTAIKNGGLTYNIVTGESNPQQGYIVSLPDREVIEPELTIESLMRYIAMNANKLIEPNKYLGIWYAEDWYLDVSVNITSREEAVKLGLKWNQLAIWDCSKKEVINIQYEVI